MIDPGMPILVVDDFATMVKIIRNLLKQIGFENIDDAADGAAALVKAGEKTYGLIISDWNMERMTGYELLANLRAGGLNTKTPFLMVTAESKTENVLAARRAGVSSYIVKPFNAALLRTRIDQALATPVAGDHQINSAMAIVGLQGAKPRN